MSKNSYAASGPEWSSCIGISHRELTGYCRGNLGLGDVQVTVCEGARACWSWTAADGGMESWKLEWSAASVGQVASRWAGGAQWARMKPNCAKTSFLLNFAADSSGALKCSFFYLLCSPFRLNNEMLTMHRQICLAKRRKHPQKIVNDFKVRGYTQR